MINLRSLVFALAVASTSLGACSARGGGSGPGPAEGPDGGVDAPPVTGDTVTPPPDGVTPPEDRVAPPEDRVAPPEDRVAPPEDRVTPPEDRVAPPDLPPPLDVSMETRCGDMACQSSGGETCASCPTDCGPCMMGGMNYRRTTTTATTVQACTLPGVRRVLASADDEAAAVPAPFDLTFFGLPVPASTPLQVSSNGFISLSSFDPTMTFFGTIPSTTPPNGVLAAYWVDLVLGADGVCAVTVGSAPSRRFIVQWRNAQFYSGVKATPTAGSASFEVIYNEADRSIDFLYDTISGQPMGAPTRAAVGVETLSGSSGLAICAGGRIDATPPAAECTMVTSGTRFRLVPSA